LIQYLMIFIVSTEPTTGIAGQIPGI
jgi:hypothetical protein